MTTGPAGDAAQGGVVGDGPSLGHQVRVSLSWSMANTLLNRSWSMVVSLILARILEPRDYGTFAVGLVALNILQSMNELGVSVAVVRWQGDPERAGRTAVTMSLVSSGLLYVACYALAPAVASALRTPDATNVLRVLTLGILLDGISSIPNAFITRALMQGRRTVADTAGLVVSTTVTLVLALRGTGAWSLVWGSLAGNATATMLLCIMAPVRPRPGFVREDARQLLAFGLPLAGSSFLVFAMLNVDYVIVGRMLGPVALGFYVLAFNLSSWPTNLLSFSIRRVSIAAFSRLADDHDRLRSQFVASVRILVTIVAPIVVVVVVLAGPVVGVLYGDKWGPSADALRFLIVLGGARVILDLCYDLLVAAGRSRSVLWVQGLWVVLLVPALSLGASAAGIRGVAIGHVAVVVLFVGPAFALALAKVGITPSNFVGLGRPLTAAALAAAVALTVSRLVDGKIVELAVAGGTSLLVYIAGAVPVRALSRQARGWRAGRRRRAAEPQSATGTSEAPSSSIR